MLDVRRLRVLRAVAAHGSFAAAAADLSYTPSAVSQQIAALEREAGAVLVMRGPRGARLTQAGRVLDRHASLVLGQLAAARAELDDLAELRAGAVRMVAFESAWSALAPTAIAAFGRRHPDVELGLAEADPGDAVAAVRAGEQDVAVVFEPNGVAAQELEGLVHVVVCEDPMRVVLPAGHPLAGRAAVPLAALAGEPWVAPTAYCAALVLRACSRAGFEPEVVFSSGDYGAIQGFVAAGAGVALVPHLALSGNPRAVWRPVDGPSPSRTVAAVTAPEGPRPPAAGALVDALCQAAGELLGVTAPRAATPVAETAEPPAA